MSEKNFVNKYLEDFSSLSKPNDSVVTKIVDAKNILLESKKNKSGF